MLDRDVLGGEKLGQLLEGASLDERRAGNGRIWGDHIHSVAVLGAVVKNYFLVVQDMNGDAEQVTQIDRPEGGQDGRIDGRDDLAADPNVVVEAEGNDGAGLDRRHPEGRMEPERAEVGPEGGLLGDEGLRRLGIGKLDGRDRYDIRRGERAFLLDSTGFHIHSIARITSFVNFKDELRFGILLRFETMRVAKFHVLGALFVQSNPLFFGDFQVKIIRLGSI